MKEHYETGDLPKRNKSGSGFWTVDVIAHAYGNYSKDAWCDSIAEVNLPISFQFHHVQMDGGHAARFLEELQKTIQSLSHPSPVGKG